MGFCPAKWLNIFISLIKEEKDNQKNVTRGDNNNRRDHIMEGWSKTICLPINLLTIAKPTELAVLLLS